MVLKNGLPKIFNDKLAGFAKARGYEPAELEFSSSGGDEIRIAAEENAALFGGNLAFSSRFQCARSDEGWNAPSEVAKSSRIRLAGRCYDEFGTALKRQSGDEFSGEDSLFNLAHRKHQHHILPGGPEGFRAKH